MEKILGAGGSFTITLLHQTELLLKSTVLLKACTGLPQVSQGKWLRFSPSGLIHNQHLSKQVGRRHFFWLQRTLN